MNRSEHYDSDLLFYFDGKPLELSLYQRLFAAMEQAFPDASVKVQKSQISFYCPKLFAAASIPVRRKKAPGVSAGHLRPGAAASLSPHCRGRGALPQPMDPPCGGIPAGGDRRGTAGLAPPGLSVLSGQRLPAVSYIQYRTDRPS